MTEELELDTEYLLSMKMFESTRIDLSENSGFKITRINGGFIYEACDFSRPDKSTSIAFVSLDDVMKDNI